MAKASLPAKYVVELGAGTGPVTRALLELHERERLTVVEFQPVLAAGLRDAFPGVYVDQDCAKDVLDRSFFGAPVALVSSLPFRSFPASVRDETIDSIARFLRWHRDSWLVQFTYQPRAPFEPPAGLAWIKLGAVWRNLPPAGIWLLRAVA